MVMVGGFNDISKKQLIQQEDNINKILLENNMKLKYGLISGMMQVVAGFNYKITIKYNKNYHVVSYFVSLNNDVTGSIFKINTKVVKYINECVYEYNSDSD